MLLRRQRTVRERFWDKVDTNNPDGRWEWLGCKSSNGYGMIRVGSDRFDDFLGKKRMIGAHRLSWLLHKGPIPESLFVCHHCDNPGCVRPDHLFPREQVDNLADASEKGLLVSLGRRFVEKDVREIRESKLSSRGVAKIFGVSQTTILRIRQNKAYKEVK